MNSDEMTTGGRADPAHHRVELAKRSLSHCLKEDRTAGDLFGDVLEAI